VAEKYLQIRQKDFNEFLKDTALINRLLNNSESLDEFDDLASKPYSIFLYSDNANGPDGMKFWNDKLITPSPDLLTGTDGEYFSHLSNGWYYTIKKTLSNDSLTGTVVSYAMVLVRSDFFIETDYLPKEFVFSKTADKRVKISDKVTEYPVRSASGATLFYLDKKISGAVPYNNRGTILLRLAALLFLILFIHLYVESVSKRKGTRVAVVLLILILFVLRLLTYSFPFIFNLRQFELFSPPDLRFQFCAAFAWRPVGEFNSFLLDRFIYLVKTSAKGKDHCRYSCTLEMDHRHSFVIPADLFNFFIGLCDQEFRGRFENII
jgi:hypothetical protein